MNADAGPGTAPSRALDEATWEHAHHDLIETLRDLIRIVSVNPPGDEILAARYVAQYLGDAGIPCRGHRARRVPGSRLGRRPASR